MLEDIIQKGSTDRSVTLRCLDSTTGAPKTDVVYNSAGIDLWYRRELSAVVSITEATLAALTTAHADGGFLHISHGYYRLDLPDAAFASGANYVEYGGTVTGGHFIGGKVKLVNFNPEDAVRMGLTALPNAAAEAAGGLYTRGTGAGQINQANNGQIDANAARTGGTTNTGRDIGASVLLSSGTGTGQVTLTSGRVNADMTHIATAAVSTSTAQLGVNVVNFGGSAGTFASGRPEVNASHAAGTAWNSGAIGPNTLAADTITAAKVAADVTTEIQSGLATAANLATVAGYLDTEIAAILADTNELQTDWADGGRLDLILDARASQSSVNTIDGIVDDILVDTAEIGAAGAGLTAVASAANLATLAGYVDTEVAAIKATTDKLDDTLEDDGGTFRFTANALEEAPSGGGGLTVQDIVDGVWDEAITDHLDSGSTGAALNAAGSAGDPWSTPLPGAYGSGTAGKIIGDNINATISSRATQTSVDDLPTNAELATALGTADDAVLTQIALVKAKTDNLPSDPADASDIAALVDALPTAAENATAIWAAGARTLTAIDEDSTTLDLDATIRAAVGLASANLDTQLGDLPTAAENATAVLGATVEGSTTLAQSLRLANAALGGKASGLDTTAPIYRDIADSKDRITATVDADGNRSAVTLDLT